MNAKDLAIAIALLGTILSAQSAKFDPGKTGPQLGQRVPDFSAPDQKSERRTLQSILGPNGAILVFNRSADW